MNTTASATATQVDTYTVKLSHEFKADREQVFRAWTDPQMLTRWFGPQGVNTRAAKVDLRVGGSYQLTMEESNGNVIEHGGVYREIDPPAKLVFSWILDGQSCERSDGESVYADTLVTLKFEVVAGGTRMTLTHEFLPSETSRQGHMMGWEGSIERLAKLVG